MRQLFKYIKKQKKQITGVEPAFPAWEASVLPMNHICKKQLEHMGFEPTTF